VKLHHFTRKEYLSLLPAGAEDIRTLPALSRGARHAGMLGQEVVWLTSDPEPRGVGIEGEVCFRIELIVPSTDRRLVRYAPWARKKLGDRYTGALEDAAAKAGLATNEIAARIEAWWFYRGQIPSSRFTGFAILPGCPWWSIDEMP
jgi:hypothetical protein